MNNGYLVMTTLMAGLCNPAIEDSFEPSGTTDLPEACNQGATIAQVQQGEYVDGDEVTIGCAVVTSELTGTEAGFFIQDPAGGEYSGVYVYLYSSVEVEDLDINIGDMITIAGAVSEYYDLTEISLATAYDVAVIGSWDPVADTVACDTTDWEPWEGCLISIPDIELTAYPDYYNEITTSCEFNLNDDFYVAEGGSGVSCTSVTGLFTYSYEEWKLNPRDEADMLGCTDPEPVDPTTIAALRQGDWSDGDLVAFEGVVATTGLDQTGEYYFIQDEGGGPYTGMVVYLSGGSSDVQQGDTLDMQGTLSEYYGLLEIKPTSTDTTGTGTPVASALSAAPADWEVYEGGLVTLSDVEITSDPDSYGEVSTNYGVNIDDLMYEHGLSDGQSLGSVTGALFYGYKTYKLCPRAADDLVE